MSRKQNHAILIFSIIIIGLAAHGSYQIHAYDSDLTALDNIAQGIPFQKGMSFTTWENFSFTKEWVKTEFQNMKDIGIEWVGINHWWWQDYLNSTEIKQDTWSDGYSNMTECFLYAKSIGLHVMYKPMLNILKTYEWRSYIYYTDDWMGNYTEWMVNNAIAAETGEVEVLCIGCEMGNMQVHSDGVREMIRQIREVFSGLLTYSANHDSFAFIDWYDALDIIGISMYTMMTITWDPSIDDLTSVWNGMYHELESLALKWNKPILFTEIGIQATDGSSMIPNDNQISQEKDISEMENYYLSLFRSKIWTASWFKGAYWWIWDSAQEGDPTLRGFNPVLIKDTIEAEYTKTHVSVLPNQILVQNIIILALCIAVSITLLGIYQRNLKKNLAIQTNQNNPEREETSKFTEFKTILATNQSEITIGLVAGSLIGFIWTNLEMSFYNVIQKAVSYALILQISVNDTIIAFALLVVSALLLSLTILKYLSKYILIIVYGLIQFYAFFILRGYVQNIFAITFIDLMICFLLVASLVNLNIKQKIKNLSMVISVGLLVLLIYSIFIKFFDSFGVVILSVPIGFASILVYLRLKNMVGKTQSQEPTQQQNHEENQNQNQVQNQQLSQTQHQSNEIPHLKMIFLMSALLTAVVIPFGNSVINLVHMNHLSIIQHYISPAIIGFILFQPLASMLSKKIKFTPEELIKYCLISMLIAIPLIFINALTIIWPFISSFILILFLGTLISTLQQTLHKLRTGRSFLYLVFIGIFFVIGFVLNGIKGLLVYTITFLVIKDGQILRRDPAIDPVPMFDVPIALNIIILVVVILLASLSLLYIAIKNKVTQNRTKNRK